VRERGGWQYLARERRGFITLLGGVAARGTRAAAGDAGDQVYPRWDRGCQCALCRRVVLQERTNLVSAPGGYER
jgi:hypothetical protein